MPNLLAVTCLERPCQVYVISYKTSITFTYALCFYVLIFLNHLSSCSQELLAAVEAERRLRSRSARSHAYPSSRIPLEFLNAEHVSLFLRTQ